VRGSRVPIKHNVARAEAWARHAKLHLDPSLWPQYTNVTDRQSGQTKETDRQTDRHTGQATIR